MMKSQFFTVVAMLALASATASGQRAIGCAGPSSGNGLRLNAGMFVNGTDRDNGIGRNNTEAELARLLQQRLDHPEQAEAIDAEIQRIFTETHAVLILDMSGFSRETWASGIIATLATIHQMQGVIAPIVETNQGDVVKFEADNLYAVFPTVEAAVQAAQQMIRQLARVQIHVGIGIGYGDILMIQQDHQDQNLYGNEVNLAAKLGEDVAEADTILLTAAAFHQMPSEDQNSAAWKPITSTLSGLQLTFYQINW